MKKLMVAGGALAVFACMGAAPTAISVPAGETVKVGAGCQFKGGVLVKTGAGTLDLSAAVLRNEGLEIREGAVLFASGGSAAVSCRYLRWNVTKTRPAKSAPPEYGNTGSQFSEFRLFRGGKMLPRPAHATAICANDWAESPKKGIDGDLKTKCYANPFVADFGEEVTFDGYSFATANDAIGRDPASWTVEAGFATAAGIQWAPIGSVQGFEAPKARFAEAAILLATAPKSNSAHNAIIAARADLKKGKTGDIPRQLQNVHADTTGFDNKQHYKYPHDYPNHWVAQQYLPDAIRNARYYEYGPNKTEQAAKAYWDKIRGKG